ncbi:MAG: hypothetical protein Q4E86_02515 [Lachnospiraceae bacterium]|nr:hypothetical protein [Lachnospiraceae bacterium]
MLIICQGCRITGVGVQIQKDIIHCKAGLVNLIHQCIAAGVLPGLEGGPTARIFSVTRKRSAAEAFSAAGKLPASGAFSTAGRLGI